MRYDHVTINELGSDRVQIDTIALSHVCYRTECAELSVRLNAALRRHNTEYVNVELSGGHTHTMTRSEVRTMRNAIDRFLSQ